MTDRIDWSAEWLPGDRVRSEVVSHVGAFTLMSYIGIDDDGDHVWASVTDGERDRAELCMPWDGDVTPLPPQPGDKVRVVGEPGIGVCKELLPALPDGGTYPECLIVRRGREYWVDAAKVRTLGPWKEESTAWHGNDEVDILAVGEPGHVRVRHVGARAPFFDVMAWQLFPTPPLRVGDRVRHWPSGDTETVSLVMPPGAPSAGAFQFHRNGYGMWSVSPWDWEVLSNDATVDPLSDCRDRVEPTPAKDEKTALLEAVNAQRPGHSWSDILGAPDLALALLPKHEALAWERYLSALRGRVTR